LGLECETRHFALAGRNNLLTTAIKFKEKSKMSSKQKEISRREFLSRSTRTAAGVFTAAALASCTSLQPAPVAAGRAIGANERINMAVIGVRGRGRGLAEGFAKIPNVRVKTLCDIDESKLFVISTRTCSPTV
jgi:hypothetical protein